MTTLSYVLDIEKNVVLKILSKATVLATGGLGQVYLHTTNPSIATGDGYAIAYRAGAKVGNMEFIQFHPTCLYHPDAKSFLISEALRGEGGVLRAKNGTPFMAHHHAMKDLAPRDMESRAMTLEIREGRGVGPNKDHINLHLDHLDPKVLHERLPGISESAKIFAGVDVTRAPIPIASCRASWLSAKRRAFQCTAPIALVPTR